jgi:hypothetical protein
MMTTCTASHLRVTPHEVLEQAVFKRGAAGGNRSLALHPRTARRRSVTSSAGATQQDSAQPHESQEVQATARTTLMAWMCVSFTPGLSNRPPCTTNTCARHITRVTPQESKDDARQAAAQAGKCTYPTVKLLHQTS